MTMWSRLKFAVLTATAAVAAFGYLGCLNLPGYNTIMKYVAIGSIFD